MSTSIDERVVYMKFDNKNFEQNAQTSLSTLDKLKESLKFNDVQDKLGQIDLSAFKNNISKINDIDTSKLNNALDTIKYRMTTLGQFTGRIVQNVADDIYSMIQKAISGIGQVVNYAESGIIQGGYQRASNIQSAKFQLEGLGIQWEEIKGDIDFAVTNTAYSLDAAALVAANLTTAGLRPGETWTDLSGNIRDEDLLAMVLRSISGTAASTGGRADYSDIGRIVTQMVSLGKVNQQQLNELSYRGIAANDVVAEYFNKIAYQDKTDWTSADIRDITGSRNETLDPYVVIEALYDKFGEHAVKANETLTGVMANTRSALARVGESFFEPLVANGGPLVSAFEVLRQSINDLNGAIKPVVGELGERTGKIIDKFVGRFAEKEYQYDEEGNETGYTWKLKEKGGLFSGFVEPLYEGEWIEKAIPGMSEHTFMQYEGEITTRAAKITQNLSDSLSNIFDIITMMGSAAGDAIRAVFPNAKGLAETLVIITEKIKNITEAWKNSRFLKDGGDWQKSDLYHILRGLAAGIDIIRRFGSSFKKHILDPIFNSGKEAMKKSGVWDYFIGMFDSIYEFDQKLQNMGDEDYFGPFFEKLKELGIKVKDAFDFIKGKVADLFSNIRPIIKNGFNDITNWWKPIKDILFNTDLSLGDKWQAIKNYFTDNFELPGWTKARDLFASIGDVIKSTWDTIKSVFGFGTKEDTLTLTTGAAGLSSGMGAAYGKKSGVVSNFKVGDVIKSLDDDTKDAPTIADRIASFFSTIGNAIMNFDFNGINAALIAFSVVLAATIFGIVYILYKAYKAIIFVVFDLPNLVGSIVKSFDELLKGLTASMRASQIASYTESLHNVAESVAMLSLAFIAIAGIMYLVMKFDVNGEGMKALQKAAQVIAMFAIIMGVIAVSMSGASGSLMETISLSKAGLQTTKVNSAVEGVVNVIKAIISAIITFSALIVILGAIDYLDEDLFKRGLKRVGMLAGILGLMLAIVAVLNWIFGGEKIIKNTNLVGAESVTKIGKSLAGIAAVISALTLGLGYMTAVIFALGYMDDTVFENGYEKVQKIAISMGIFISAVWAVLSLINMLPKTETLAMGKIVGLLLGMSVLFTVMVGAVVVLSGTMILLSKAMQSTDTSFTEMIGMFVTMALFLVAVPGALMGIAKFTMPQIGVGEVLSLAAFVAAISVASLIISKAISNVAILDQDAAIHAMVGLGAILLIAGGLLYVLSKTSDDSMIGSTLKSALSIGILLTALYPVSLAIEKLTTIDWSDYGQSLLKIAGILIIVGGIAIGLNAISKEADISDASKLALNVLMFSLSLLPLAAGMYIMVKAFSITTEGGYWGKMGLILATLVAYFGLIAGTMMLLDKVDTANPPSIKSILAIISTVWTVSLAMLPVAAALSMLFFVLSQANLEPLLVLNIMIGFAVIMAGIGAAVYLMTQSVANTKVDGKSIAGILGVLVGILLVLGGVAGIIVLAVNKLVDSGAATIQIATVALAIIGIGLVIKMMAEGLLNYTTSLRWSDNLLKKFGIVFGAIVVIALSMGIVALALAKVAAYPWQQILSAGLALTVLGLIISAMDTSLIAYAREITWSKNLLKKLGVVFGGMIAISGMMLIVSFALAKVASMDIGPIWNSVAVLTVMGVVIGLMTGILIGVVSKGISSSEIGGAVVTLVSMVAAAFSLWLVGNAVAQLGKLDATSIERATESMVVIGLCIAAMAAVVMVIGKHTTDWEKSLASMGMVITCAGSIWIVAQAMAKLKDMDLDKIVKSMIVFGGALVILIVVLVAAQALSGGIATPALLAFGAAAVGLALLMLAAGAAMYLAASAIEKGAEAVALLVDTIVSIKDKKSEFSEGMMAFFEGLVDGITAGLAKLDEKMPLMLFYLQSIMNKLQLYALDRATSFVKFLKDFLTIMLRGLAEIAQDKEIRESLAIIIDSILSFVEDNIATWTERMVGIGQQLAIGLIDGLLDPQVQDVWRTLVENGVEKAAEAWVSVKKFLGIKDKKEGGGGGRIPATDEQIKEQEQKERLASMGTDEYEDYNVASAKRNSQNQNNVPSKDDMLPSWAKKKNDNQYSASANSSLDEYDKDLNSGFLGNKMTKEGINTVSKWRKSNDDAWSKLNKGQNYFSEATENSIIEFSNRLDSDIGTSIGTIAGAATSMFSNDFSGVSGEASATSLSYATYGNPVWNDCVTNSASYLDSSVKGGEIYKQLNTTVGGLHTTFDSMLNSPSSALITNPNDIMTNPFSRKIFQYLAQTRTDVEGPTIGGMMKTVSNSVFDAFSQSCNPAIMTDKTIPIGNAVTAGIYVGVVDPNSLQRIKNAGYKVSDTMIDALKSKRGFNINSPAKKIYEYITKNIVGGLTELKSSDISAIFNTGALSSTTFLNGSDSILMNADSAGENYNVATAKRNAQAGQDAGTSYGDNFIAAFGTSFDVSGIKQTISDNFHSKIPSIQSLYSEFSFDKGISGNIDVAKESWNTIKSAFTDESGGIDVSWIFAGVSDQLSTGFDSLLSQFGISDDFSMESLLGIDTSSMGLGEDSFNISDLGINFSINEESFNADQFTSAFSEYGGWDANDLMANNVISLETEVDDASFNNWMNQQRTIELASTVPVTGGYQQSTAGNTYVNNYSYNQTNNSPTALSTREINRQNELLMSRRMGNRR